MVRMAGEEARESLKDNPNAIQDRWQLTFAANMIASRGR